MTPKAFAATLNGHKLVPGECILNSDQHKIATSLNYLVIYAYRNVYSGSIMLETEGYFSTRVDWYLLESDGVASLTPLGFWGVRENKAWNTLGKFTQVLLRKLEPMVNIWFSQDSSNRDLIEVHCQEEIPVSEFAIRVNGIDMKGIVVDMKGVATFTKIPLEVNKVTVLKKGNNDKYP